MRDFKIVGKRVKKIDAALLARGKPLFTDDIKLEDMLHARILWSPHAHARIRNIDTSEAEALPGVHAVLCYKNVPRVLYTSAGQGWPEPSPYDMVMFDNKVRYVGDRVAAVAAETEEIAEKALRLIKVDYEILPAVFDPEKAMEEGAPVIHDEPDCRQLLPLFYDPKHNHCAHIEVKTGDPERGLKEADVVVEHTIKNHYAQHCALEPHSCISYLDHTGRLVVRSSTQVPYYARRIIAHCLQLPERMVRVIKPRIGGGFGSKQEIVVEDVCAMFTLRTKRPVRLVFNRPEVFVSTRTRHPMIMKVKTGVKKDGTVTAIEMRVISNTGAYGPHCMTVLGSTCAKTLPLYRCQNIKFIGDTVYTNLLNAGAYRGYGVLQGTFAMGIMMDEMAHAIGMDPVEFWKKNTIRVGETSPIFSALSEIGKGAEQKVDSCALPECIDRGAEAFGWKEKRERYRNQPDGPLRRGVGMVCTVHGGTVALLDASSVTAKMNEDGSFNLLISASDVGGGCDTVLSQIFAEALDIPLEDVVIYATDTDVTPYDKGAYASGTTYLSGLAVIKTAEEIKKQILRVASEMLNEPPENLKLENKGVVSTKSGSRVEFSQIARRAMYSKNQFQIAATASEYSHLHPQTFTAQFAEVEVDKETGQVKVLSYVCAVDCGTAINPTLAEGQVEGSIVNGISYALTEEFIFDENGRVLNPNFRDYKIFSAPDIPKIKTILVPSYDPTGPFGAKPIGEPAIDGVLPTISNAIYNAIGIRFTESPFTPEKVLRAIKQRKR
ncbi:MAG: molybdopterin cofactor-binding domain-containing protein [Candidatus Hadarchaeum sp.]|uniref:xanthine dehydrogenase family protein molybdopterin-binding subunit n=1 Tax=Candidatus Hadarchaeum sp. TaxID=2883567 RepID=UPI003172B3CF